MAGSINLTASARPLVGNNTSLLGVGSTAVLNGGGLRLDHASNVIIRNLGINHVVGDDSITVTFSNNVWIDHCELWSDRTHGVDFYDGQVRAPSPLF